MSILEQIILAVPPAGHARAAPLGRTLAHMAYRVGEGGQLLRAEIPPDLGGGLMVLDAAGFDGRGDPARLCREVARECVARRFEGVLCDFDGPPAPFLERAAAQLGPLLHERGQRLWVTESCAAAWDKSVVLIPSAITAGSLEARLREAVGRYGAERLALAVQRMAVEFRLPAGAEGGRPLEHSELAARIRRFSPAVFFDGSLCAHYFTYMEHGSARFVLFDDSGSLLRKLSLARELGIRRAILTFPEVEDILPRLLGG